MPLFQPCPALLCFAIRCSRYSVLLLAVLALLSAQSTRLSAAPQEKPAEQTEQTEQAEKGHSHTNKLIGETSPYLLMHAHNPVDWYPWGEEALKKAKDENKPIFLSIGYSSCHWCHVMERESFLDEEIAKYLNENFVCIKVDREERPDIDTIYMTALQVFNQLTRNRRSGGWPLTMFMTPDGRPFFGGSYFPARTGDRGSMPGFLTLSQRVNEAWNARRDRVLLDAEKLTDLTRTELNGRRDKPAVPINAVWSKECLDVLKSRFDPTHGGFGFNEANPGVPKFPQASNLFYLLSLLKKDGENADAKRMLETTLDQMFQGGIYDHVGGGFHRYSVDRYWHIPHFEKMLYDNGQLLSVYAEALQYLPKDEYRQVCQEIVTFVLREMTAEGGGFYSALDAESEGEEGKFYRWEKEELQKTLTAGQFEKYAAIYRINEAPNFEQKYYAPQLTQTLVEIAKKHGQDVPALQAELRSINDALLQVRSARPRPLLDSKILTSWNGLMIRGLADAGRAMKKPEYTAAAAKAADFLLQNSLIEGRLLRTYTAGEARLNAYLDDYVFLIDGLIGLHRADGNQKWLDRANELQQKQNELFWDDKAGGYFFTSTDHESLLARAKQPADNANPSGNSVAVHNLIYLGKQLKNEDYLKKAKSTFDSVSNLLEDLPSVTPRLLETIDEFTASDK